MALYANLIDKARREVREAPSEAIGNEIRSSVIEFCQRTRSWRDYQTIFLSPGQHEYRLRFLMEGRVDQVLSCDLRKGTEGRAIKKVEVTDRFKSGRPAYFSESPGYVRFSPVPDEDGYEARLHVIYVPAVGSRTYPDFIYDEWREAVTAGAVSRLLLQPDRPWSNPDRGLYLEREFHLAVRDARQKAQSGNWVPQSIPLRRWV